MNMYFYCYKLDDGTAAANFIIAADPNTAIAMLPENIPALIQVPGVNIEGPERVIAGIGLGLFP